MGFNIDEVSDAETLNTTTDDDFDPNDNDSDHDSDETEPDDDDTSPFIVAKTLPQGLNLSVFRSRSPQPNKVKIVNNSAKSKLILTSLADEGIKSYSPPFEYFLFTHEGNPLRMERGFLKATKSTASMDRVKDGKDCHVILLPTAADRMRVKLLMQDKGLTFNANIFAQMCTAVCENKEDEFLEANPALKEVLSKPLVSYSTAVSNKATPAKPTAGAATSAPPETTANTAAVQKKRKRKKIPLAEQPNPVTTKVAAPEKKPSTPPVVKRPATKVAEDQPVAKKSKPDPVPVETNEKSKTNVVCSKTASTDPGTVSVTYTGSLNFVTKVVEVVSKNLQAE